MFSKAPRFVPDKPSETPGPNHYVIPEEEGWDSYKRGAFLEKADRFGKDKPYEGPDSAPSTSDQSKGTKDASRMSKRPEAGPSVAALRQQIEALQSQNGKLERLHETESRKHQEQAASDKLKIESLTKQASHLDVQLRAAKAKLERQDAGGKDTADRNAKYVAMRKELDDLQRLHDDGKKVHRSELQQMKTEHERHQKSTTEQVANLKRQLEAAEMKASEHKKSLQVAHDEISDLRAKSRLHEKQKASSAEAETLKKTLASVELAKKERDSRITELEKQLHVESQQRKLSEGKLEEMKTKLSSTAEESKECQGRLKLLEKEIAELKSVARDTTTKLDAAHAALDQTSGSSAQEIEALRTMLRYCSELYRSLLTSSVAKEDLDAERLQRYELQSRLLKAERRLSDKEAQLQEFVSYLRHKDDQQRMLISALRDMEQEATFLRENRPTPDDFSQQANKVAYQDRLDENDNELDTNLVMVDLLCSQAIEDYYRDWAQTLLDEYRTIGHCANSLEAALTTVLERTAELDGRLQGAEVESNSALKRARDAEAQMVVLRQEFDTMKEKKEQQIFDLATEKDVLAEESVEAKRKLDEIQRRTERMETTLREKSAAEQALSEDVEGLSDALRDAMRYEHAYKSLCQEVDALVSRNQLVERESEHLSRFNAEILGHTNPNQKIHYLDRIRRDLADAKQKLAVSTKQREAVLEDNDTLRTELHAYRSLSESQNRRANVTRITRQPLGMSTLNAFSQDSTGDGLPKVLEDQTLILPRSTNSPMTLDELM